MGSIKEGERIFHLDGYYPNQEHRTFDFFRNEPSYNKTKDMVIGVLTGKINAKSSSRMGGK